MTDTAKAWIDLRQEAINRRSEPDSDWTVDDSYHELPRALNALEKVLDVHTRISVEHAVYGHTDVCGQCSEDRMFALWPCETVEAIEGAIND